LQATGSAGVRTCPPSCIGGVPHRITDALGYDAGAHRGREAAKALLLCAWVAKGGAWNALAGDVDHARPARSPEADVPMFIDHHGAPGLRDLLDVGAYNWGGVFWAGGGSRALHLPGLFALGLRALNATQGAETFSLRGAL
jgi:hypothetical protein